MSSISPHQISPLRGSITKAPRRWRHATKRPQLPCRSRREVSVDSPRQSSGRPVVAGRVREVLRCPRVQRRRDSHTPPGQRDRRGVRVAPLGAVQRSARSPRCEHTRAVFVSGCDALSSGAGPIGIAGGERRRRFVDDGACRVQEALPTSVNDKAWRRRSVGSTARTTSPPASSRSMSATTVVRSMRWSVPSWRWLSGPPASRHSNPYSRGDRPRSVGREPGAGCGKVEVCSSKLRTHA